MTKQITFEHNIEFMLSKSCEYAIRSVIYIAGQSSKTKRTNLREISNAINSPEAFTSKILQSLTAKSILHSTKGPSGGFEISTDRLNTLSLAEIIFAIDGIDVFSHCVIGLEKCSDNHPCPVHHKYLPIKNEIKHFFRHTLVKDVVNDLSLLNTFISP